MSVATEIQRIQIAKTDLNAALGRNGITIPNTAKIDSYPDYVVYNGHEYVDFGLPSGTLWATMNIGANSITDSGLYFQWGDTTGYLSGNVGTNGTAYKKPFVWADYKFSGGRTSPGATGMTKYNANDGKYKLDIYDDAARTNWGGNWRMPTTEEFQELSGYTTSAYTDDCLVLTSTVNGNTLTFPLAGYANNNMLYNVGAFGLYWSSSPNTSSRDNAYGMHIVCLSGENVIHWDGYHSRYFGFPIRPVIG